MNARRTARYWTAALAIGSVLFVASAVTAQAQPFGVPVAIVNTMGRCLDVAGAVNAQGTNVQIWDCNGTVAQVWTFFPGGRIQNVMGRCLDVAGAVNAQGTNVQIWDCNGTVAQIWNIVALTPPPPPAPVVFSQGGFQLTPQQQVNLDNGNIGAAGADIHYQVVAFTRQLAPVNGAQISFTNGAQRGFAGCSAAAFNNGPVLQAALSIGNYVCVRTSQGRISEFRLDNIGQVLGILTISYTTWQ